MQKSLKTISQKQMDWEWAMSGNTTEVKNKFLTTMCLIEPGTMP